jgi:hypothetical protein
MKTFPENCLSQIPRYVFSLATRRMEILPSSSRENAGSVPAAALLKTLEIFSKYPVIEKRTEQPGNNM